MNPPKWAQDFILKVLLYQNSKGLSPIIPLVNWRHHKHTQTSGTSYPRVHKINICAGSKRLDAKLVIAHELTHNVLSEKEHHSETFWNLAWDLYHYLELPIRYCKKREFEYKVGAMKAYHKLQGTKPPEQKRKTHTHVYSIMIVKDGVKTFRCRYCRKVKPE